MRHPTTGLSQDDLSRLTGSSSSTASCGSNTSSSSSSSSTSSAENTHAHQDIYDEKSHSTDKVTITATATTGSANVKSTRFSSTYLPEIINPLEWQKSRKRKERLDSTSSATTDHRKLHRSNSEELLPPITTNNINIVDEITKDGNSDKAGNNIKCSTENGLDAMRRVSSEDFQKTPTYSAYLQQELKQVESTNNKLAENETINNTANENDASAANRKESTASNEREISFSVATKDLRRRSRNETSPMRSHRLSPIRSSHSYGNGNGSGRYSDSNDSECEHERRRSSERFCKTRAPPGRKAAGVSKKSSANANSTSSAKYYAAKRSDENVYKYDLSALKYERRGFISSKTSKAAFAAEKSSSSSSDLNDNNLIDFHQQKHQQKKHTTPISPTPSSCGSDETVIAMPIPSATTPLTSPHQQTNINNRLETTSAQDALPWERSEDQPPVLSRHATFRPEPVDNLDVAAKLSKIMPYPQPQHKQQMQLLADEMDCIEPIDTYRAFTSLENMRTREVMQQVIPAMMSFQSPEERLKQVNKRLTAMKKKLSHLEEGFEQRMGYRPSQAERLNDKYMKNVLAELSKLRKERHELKSDPMAALGLKVVGNTMDAKQKLDKMKITMQEIEQSLTEKRGDRRRSEVLEELTADQLVQEKSAVQHGLLYFESLYGRPATKEERDAARPLYDRYRQLKRMVSRTVMLSGVAAAGAPDLPTILEHEAMVFDFTPQQYSSNNSTDTTNSPTESVAPNASSDDSTTNTNTTAQDSQSASTSTDANENISDLNLDQLWEQLDKTREEKKVLKNTIREYETIFEEQNGRKMLKNDRKFIEETYAQYKEKKAKTRLLQALIKKHISR